MNKRGQSIIEYVLIAILVIFGVVMMGPYVLRSINAYFKLWDDSVQDSFEEKLQQAPENAIPTLPAGCQNCSNQDEGCGSNQPGSPCAAGYHAYKHTCTPLGCDYSPEEECTPDCSCCTQPIFTGCGTVPLPAQYLNGAAPPESQGSGMPAPNNCYYGQAIIASQCGATTNCTNIPPEACSNDPQYNCPQPACLGVIYQGLTQPCPGATTGLDQNYPIVIVPNPQDCDATKKCQYINCCSTVKVYVDNFVSIYASDAKGDMGRLLFQSAQSASMPPNIPNITQTGFYSGTFPLNIDSSGTSYVLAVVTNTGDLGGIALDVNGSCYSQAFVSPAPVYNIPPSTFLLSGGGYSVGNVNFSFTNGSLVATPSLNSCQIQPLASSCPLTLDNTNYPNQNDAPGNWANSNCWISFRDHTPVSTEDVHAILLKVSPSCACAPSCYLVSTGACPGEQGGGIGCFNNDGRGWPGVNRGQHASADINCQLMKQEMAEISAVVASGQTVSPSTVRLVEDNCFCDYDLGSHGGIDYSFCTDTLGAQPPFPVAGWIGSPSSPGSPLPNTIKVGHWDQLLSCRTPGTDGADGGMGPLNEGKWAGWDIYCSGPQPPNPSDCQTNY